MSRAPEPTPTPAKPDWRWHRLAALVVLAAGVSLALAWLAHRLLGLQLRADSVWQALAPLLLYPLLEEWVFRAGVQQWLWHKLARAHLANLLASLVFVALHLPAQGMAALWVLLPSLALGELWRRRQSLAWCVASHAWFNLSLMLVSQGLSAPA